MAVDPSFIDNSGGAPSYSGADLRLGLILPHFAGAGASLGVYSGVRLSGSGTDLLTQAQASPNMSVRVQPGAFVAQGGISSAQGPYTWCLDTTTTLTISAAHATLDRTDLVAVRIRDANVDTSGQRDGAVMVITGTAGSGTPALPTDASYFVLAQVSVPHGVTTIGGGGGTITDKRAFCASLGGVLPFVSTARPSSCMDGQPGWETDTSLRYTYRAGSLNKWVRELQYLTITQFSTISASFADTGFTFPGDANAVYAIDSWLSTVAPTANDLSLQWSLPTGATVEWSLLGPASTDAGTNLTTTVYQGTSTSTGPLTIGGMNNTGAVGILRGTITLSSTAGTCKLQGAQASAGGTSFIRAASWMTTRQTG